MLHWRLLLLLFAAVVPAYAEVSATDDASTRVVLTQPAQRIVSLAPHLTELLFAAGAGPRIVAVVDFSDFPDDANRLPLVGSYAAPDVERIARLKPDLVVGWSSGNPPAALAQLARLGVPVFRSEPRRLEDIAATLRRLGTLAGSSGTAERAAADFESRLAGLKARYYGRRTLRVFYEIWDKPLMTVGGDHVISAAIALCGGRNVFAEIGQPAAAVSLEAVLRADPEVIVASGMDRRRPEWLDAWRRWPQLSAVGDGALFFVPPDLIQRHTPRLLEGTQLLCEALDAARERRLQPGR